MRKQLQRLSLFFVAISLTVGLVALRSQAVTQNRLAEEKLARDYVQAMELVREHYVVPVEYETLTNAAISGMLRVLDPHSSFYDRKAFDEMRMEQRSQYFGIGASIQSRLRGVYIMETFKDTPAARAGLRYGDEIIKVDGESTETWNSDKVRDHLRGELGTEVKVTVVREGVSQPITVTLERAAVDLPSISGYYILKPGVGYIALSRGFHSTTSDELTTAINILKEQGMNQLILDLRGNPGGFLDQAIRVGDKFLQRGQTVVSVRSREGKAGDRDWQAESGAPENFPMVVMIDDGTASASEIVAGAIQDHDRALIVGEPSFGKGLVQTIYPLSGGTGLTLTTARYFTPSGRLIQRDYSNGSVYEYHFRRNANGDTKADDKAKNQMRRTDLGRTVYGGGGIEPDIKVEEPTISNEQAVIWTTGLFMFVRKLLAGEVAVAASFKRDGIEFDHQPQSGEFVISDDILKAYRGFMTDFIAKNPDYGVTVKMVDEHLEWSRSKIREEVLLAAYGVDTQKRMMADEDVQLQRGIAEMSNSAQLAEKARRLTKASKK
ncbi:MAG TPA: S41 family peptidase [Blastocatellia bacterium]|nr:S41 family peptidase [Blastocatellia bacterium]